MADTLETARRLYAEEICRLHHISSPAILAAFAAVPRERFVGPGPWLIEDCNTSWFTRDADPVHLYRDALVALDEAKHLNNGQPSLWATHLALLRIRSGEEILHLGCGTGYYTAILAELTGAAGKVTAIEIDKDLAQRAQSALEPWPQVKALQGDGSRGPFAPADAIVVSAGATHPPAAWLKAVKPGGRLLFPLTSDYRSGSMAYLRRTGADGFAAALRGAVLFVEFTGARDAAIGSRLDRALRRDQGASVRSLRCDAHEEDASCWLHGEDWCFSRRDPVTGQEA